MIPLKITYHVLNNIKTGDVEASTLEVRRNGVHIGFVEELVRVGLPTEVRVFDIRFVPRVNVYTGATLVFQSRDQAVRVL